MKYLSTKLIFIVFSYLFVCGTAESFSAEPQDELPSSVLPEKYILKIIPFLNNLTFEGEVSIRFSTLDNKTQVAFEAGNLVIKGIYLEHVERNISVPSNLTEETLGRWLISTEHSLLGVYKLQILFSGQINDIKEEGIFYYASYVNNETKSLYAATRSKMEGQQTCQLFPCLVRSTVQTPVTVFIARFANQTSHSNMPVKSSSKPDDLLEGRIWDEFYETPNISPQQVGCSVHELSSLSNRSFTILAASDVLEQASLALSLLPTVEKALQSWFMNSTFPFPKLDIMAFPDTNVDMAHSPGLAFCREDKLLYKEWITNAQSKFTITLSLVNVLAHQWFSHQITFQSWLIDGIVTYLEYKIVSELEPLWQMNKLFFREIFQKAMNEDYENHKVSNNTDLTLSKRAAAVLKMAETMSSEAVIRESLQTLCTISSGQVSLNQLFAALDNATDKSADLPSSWSLSAVLQMWVFQPGYPVLTIAENESSLFVKQDDFHHKGNEWPIFLTYTTQNDTQLGVSYLHTWLLPGERQLVLPVNESAGWVLLNEQNSGYYRVKYSSKYWQLLLQQLMANHSVIPAVSRSQLIDDAFQLAWAVELDYSFVFDLGYYLPNETNHIPWATAAENFDQLLRLFYGTQLGRDLQKYVQELYSPYFASVIDMVSYNEPLIAKRSRMEAFHWACHWQLPRCVQFATALFKHWQSSTFRFPPEYKPAALCTGVKLFPSVFFEVFDSFTASNVAADRLVFIAALACTSNQTHLSFLLRTAFLQKNQMLIRHNEKTKLLEGIIVTPENVHLVVTFLVLNYNKTISVVGTLMMDSIWTTLGNSLVLEDDIKLVQRLIDDASLSIQARKPLNCSLSTARALQLDATRLAPLVSRALRSVTPLTTAAGETPFDSSPESSTHSDGCSALRCCELFLVVVIAFAVVINKI